MEEYRPSFPSARHARRHPARGWDTLVPAPRLSERVGAQVWLKVEGANPTGSFKDRGMTMAISMAVDEGAKAVVCASTGNTSASAAAYAPGPAWPAWCSSPRGTSRLGKLAQALVHGARVLQVRGNFDQLLTIVRELPEPRADHGGQLGQPAPHRRAEDGRLRDRRRPGRRPRCPLHPGWQRRQHHGLLAGLPAVQGGRPLHQAAAHARLPGRRCRADRLGHPVENPETIATAIRIGNPASWYSATAAASESGGSITAVTDRRFWAYTFLAQQESVFCEAASAASVAGLIKDRRARRLQGGVRPDRSRAQGPGSGHQGRFPCPR
jgi:threonine synthase